ncbi:thiosulfate/3-mercaptopyruvate sulfurtransferase [Streptomyces olivoverticillatus]|uniref:Thiosulfate/3-mercaptopyruvate sulfurtransferase n=1 Tax=Streptomyces olivoverticillatus TaxID=66427 RepID=A0A7W7PMW8_9ACTN|nr:sulfurtransferase [Streptomyces olivoverticillatus]MBB4895804.1 thiosulfate/3-mercaptopyruvate sulfurtransferase [Streptomyces olivoverticillatus]
MDDTISKPAVNPTISATEWAHESAVERPPVLLDVRYQPGGPAGLPEYEAGHLPGAVFVDMETAFAGPAGLTGRHPLPDLAVFGAAMRGAGVRSDHPVVVYDGGLGWAAARAWWMLRWAGHRDVRVLDGGLAAWTAQGGAVTTDVPAVPTGDFVPEPGALPLLDADGAAALARRGLLFDARAGERYRGEVEPLDAVAGHIPGAVSAPTMENVTADGSFLPAADLAARFAALGAAEATEVGVYCGSGVSGAHEVLALAVAGIPAALYVGSWSEWSSDPNRPVATGPQPG